MIKYVTYYIEKAVVLKQTCSYLRKDYQTIMVGGYNIIMIQKQKDDQINVWKQK